MKCCVACLVLLLLIPTSAIAARTVDVNSANERMLARALDGLGQGGAKAIVDYRKEHGAFRSMEQLALVKGVDLSAVERNRERIVLGNGRGKDASHRYASQEGKGDSHLQVR